MGVTERIEGNLSALACLIGEDNVEDVKKRIGNLIVDRVASDIRHYDCYLFYPPDFNGCIEEAFEKIEKKIVKMYSDAALECAKESVQRFKDISTSMVLETPGLQLRSCHKCQNKDNNKCKFYEDKYWTAHDHICAEEGFTNFIERKE